MISKTLTEDMKSAMKSGDKVRLGVIRMLIAEIKNARIAAGEDLSEEQEEKIIAAYAKKRKETMETYKEAGRPDLVEKEKIEFDITMSYLPAQLDDDELKKIVRAKVAEAGAESMKDFGRVMKAVMAEVGSRADGSAVSAMVKTVMNEKG